MQVSATIRLGQFNRGVAPETLRGVSSFRPRCRFPSVPSQYSTGGVAPHRRKLIIVRSSSDDPSKSDKEENPIVQELLVDMIKIETEKEEVNKYVERESDNLRLIVEEV